MDVVAETRAVRLARMAIRSGGQLEVLYTEWRRTLFSVFGLELKCTCVCFADRIRHIYETHAWTLLQKLAQGDLPEWLFGAQDDDHNIRYDVRLPLWSWHSEQYAVTGV